MRKITASVLLGLCLLSACVDPYNVTYNTNSDLLTVEGFVSDQGPLTVSIKISRSRFRSNYAEAVKGCVAELIVGDGKKIALTESTTSPGNYLSPADFKGIVGQTYQLRFRTAENKTYESPAEKLTVSPPIEKVYQTFDPRGLLDVTGKLVVGSTFNVYIDTQDPGGVKNFYLWKTTLYERQDVCITCEGGFYNEVTARCVSVPRSTTNFDYACSGRCFEILKDQDINIFSDVFSDGKPIVSRLVRKVPYFSPSGALLEIEQFAVSSGAYRYYDLLKQQAQTTGTLTDTPPAPIVGNIRNINDSNEIVVGYFGTAGSSKVRYWVERSGANGGILLPLLGRLPNYEPTSAPPPRPPSAPCIPSSTRTPFVPEGWRN